jgi:hypothetical protein
VKVHHPALGYVGVLHPTTRSSTSGAQRWQILVRIDYVLSGQPRRRGIGGMLAVRRAADRPVDGVWAPDHVAVVVDLA